MRHWSEASSCSDDDDDATGYRIRSGGSELRLHGSLSEEHLKALTRLASISSSSSALDATAAAPTAHPTRHKSKRHHSARITDTRQGAPTQPSLRERISPQRKQRHGREGRSADAAPPPAPPQHADRNSGTWTPLDTLLGRSYTTVVTEGPEAAQAPPSPQQQQQQQQVEEEGEPRDAPRGEGGRAAAPQPTDTPPQRVVSMGSMGSSVSRSRSHSAPRGVCGDSNASRLLGSHASAASLAKVAAECSAESCDLDKPQLVGLLKKSASLMKGMHAELRKLRGENEALKRKAGQRSCEETQAAVDMALQENAQLAGKVAALQQGAGQIPKLRKEIAELREENSLAVDEIARLRLRVMDAEEKATFHKPSYKPVAASLQQRARRIFAPPPDPESCDARIESAIAMSPYADTLSKVDAQTYRLPSDKKLKVSWHPSGNVLVRVGGGQMDLSAFMEQSLTRSTSVRSMRQSSMHIDPTEAEADGGTGGSGLGWKGIGSLSESFERGAERGDWGSSLRRQGSRSRSRSKGRGQSQSHSQPRLGRQERRRAGGLPG